MNLTNERVKMLTRLYNEFREFSGKDLDYSPVKNLFETSDFEVEFIEDTEDEAAWTSTLTPPIEIAFEFGKCDTDEMIEKKIKEFRIKVLKDKRRHWASFNWMRGRNWVTIQNNLERSLKAIKAGTSYPVIAAELKLVDSKAPATKLKSADREAKRLFMHGQLLVDSSNSFIEFCHVAIKPLPRDI